MKCLPIFIVSICMRSLFYNRYAYDWFNFAAELVWLARLSFAWKDVDRLRQDATKLPGSSGPYAFRGKLLQTTLSMQQALGLTDLGSVFHRPFQHPGDGSVVMCTVAHVKNPKLSPPLSSLSLKWVPLGKAQRRVSFDGQVGAMDALRYSLREQILYQQVISTGEHSLYQS